MKTSRTNDHLSDKQLGLLREKVLQEVERIEYKLHAKDLGLNLNQETSGDEVDTANNEIIKNTQLRFSTRETLYLKKLNKTKIMLESQDYGICEDCGGEISFIRLQARPTSTMCITCKEESERDELQSFHGRKSKSLGNTEVSILR
jgi:DnaK suppressor protein